MACIQSSLQAMERVQPTAVRFGANHTAYREEYLANGICEWKAKGRCLQSLHSVAYVPLTSGAQTHIRSWVRRMVCWFLATMKCSHESFCYSDSPPSTQSDFFLWNVLPNCISQAWNTQHIQPSPTSLSSRPLRERLNQVTCQGTMLYWVQNFTIQVYIF